MEISVITLSIVKTSLIALAVAASFPAMASVTTINFDGVDSGSLANSAAPAGIEFFQAHLVNDLDIYGDEIIGTAKWQVDEENNSLTPVTAANPLMFDYGPAPSANNALDARWQPVLMRFALAQNLSGFSLTLDNSSYGDVAPSSLLFLDSQKMILGYLNFDQSLPGGHVNLTNSIAGVKEILLPSGAFYDDISVSPVPEPPAGPLLMVGAAMLGMIMRRRAKKP